MLYLGSVRLPREDEEFSALYGDHIAGVPRNHKYIMTCYENHYPFGVFPRRELDYVEFAPITVFAGGNGSGKSTLLNVIAEKLSLARSSPFNTTPFFQDYIRLCRVNDGEEAIIPRNSRIITSDDVFQSILNSRRASERRDAERDKLLGEYWSDRHRRENGGGAGDGRNALVDREERRRSNMTLKTPSQYVNRYISRPVDEASNGECALEFFTNAIGEDTLYLLDEPENSLSAVFQERLVQYLFEAVRFYGCQLVIATHSPILMSLPEARVYDMDARPVCVRRWTELENVRLLRDFFLEHDEEFQ